jgi:hypothetical protein
MTGTGKAAIKATTAVVVRSPVMSSPPITFVVTSGALPH